MKSKFPLMMSLLLAAGIASAQAPNTNQPPAPVQSTDQGTTEPAKDSAAGKHKGKSSKHASAHKDAASGSGEMAEPAKGQGKTGAAGEPAMHESGAKH